MRCNRPYDHSPDWLKKEKTTINPKYKADKCFQHVVNVALNYGESESYPERVSNVKPFIKKYEWKGIKLFIKNWWLENVWEEERGNCFKYFEN